EEDELPERGGSYHLRSQPKAHSVNNTTPVRMLACIAPSPGDVATAVRLRSRASVVPPTRLENPRGSPAVTVNVRSPGVPPRHGVRSFRRARSLRSGGAHDRKEHAR